MKLRCLVVFASVLVSACGSAEVQRPTEQSPVSMEPTPGLIIPVSAPLPPSDSTTLLAGSSAPAVPSAPAAPIGVPGGAPLGPNGCAVGELCQAAMVGGFKFCSPMVQPIPPTCEGANTPCGPDLAGTCFDGGPVGFPGMFYCIHSRCLL